MKRFATALICLLVLVSCKKETEPETTEDPLDEVAEVYEKAGFGYLGRFDTYLPDVPGSYYITPLDIRKVNGKLFASWQIEQAFYGSFHIYTGSLENKKFVKSDYEACGDPKTSSDFRRVLNHEFDGQGNLFTSYRYRDNTSLSATWFHSFCSSSGLTSMDEYRQYQMDIAENNQVVTAVGAKQQYNGYELPDLRYYSYGISGWQDVPVPDIKPKVQSFDYCVTENGNGFLAYTDAPQGDVTSGNMNLVGYNGVSWVNLGSIPLLQVRKLIVNYFEPFEVRIIRNGDQPFIVLFRENNTIAVLWFDGVSLQLIADNVPYPYNPTQPFTVTTKTDLCVYNNKLTAYGFGNSLGMIDDPHSVYQLNGGSFALLKTLDASNITLRGVYSDNTRLWAACEVFRADNGVLRSPVDIIEIK